MADELNGRESPGSSGRSLTRQALRVTFVLGSAPEGMAGGARIDIEPGGRLTVDGAPQEARLTAVALPGARLDTGKGTHRVLVHELPDPRRTAQGLRRVEVVLDGWRFELEVESAARARLRELGTSARDDARRGGPSELRAIIPGRVVSVDVAEGDAVEAGRRLLVLEAMKMQNEVKAPRAGTVARVAVGPGETVELGDVLLVLE